MKARTKTKARMPEPDEKLHAVLIEDGLSFFGELIESHDFWFFVADFTAKDLMKAIMTKYYGASLPGDAHTLVLPLTAPPVILVALRKTFMSPAQLGKQLRQHAGLRLSPAEVDGSDVFLAVARFRVPFAVELVNDLTGKRPGTPIYGCPN